MQGKAQAYDFVSTIANRLLCGVCGQLPHSGAEKSECCGRVFCKSDLKYLRTEGRYVCPICHADPLVTWPDLAVEREIKQLKVYCPNKGDGCLWVGELAKVDDHLNWGRGCEITCNNCQAAIHHTAMSRHASSECPCYCQYCDTTTNTEEISKLHKDKCNSYPLPCPNKCGQDSILRCNMDEHKKVCPFQKVRCEYYSVGCRAPLLRRNLSEHNLTNMARHLKLLEDLVFQKTGFFTRRKFSLALCIVFVFVAYLIVYLQCAIVRSDIRVKELNNTVNKLYNASLTCSTTMWPLILHKKSSQNDTIIPVLHGMYPFSKYLKKEIAWSSSKFLYFEAGYELFLRVYAAGYNVSSGTHVSVYLYLSPGPNDDNIQWPLKMTLKIELLNQVSNQDHHTRYVKINSERVTTKSKGIGHQGFVSHDNILQGNYLKDNTLHFKVSFQYDNQSEVLSVTKINVTNFTYQMYNKEFWYSDPFFAFEDGYQMCLVVVASGAADGKGTHVSVAMNLMKGPYDDELEQSGHFPLRGIFTIVLIDQIDIKHHIAHDVIFDDNSPVDCANRVVKNKLAPSAWGAPQFISHDAILHNINSDYLKNDTLYFKVSIEHGQHQESFHPIIWSIIAGPILSFVEVRIRMWETNNNLSEFPTEFITCSIMIGAGTFVMGSCVGGILWLAITFGIIALSDRLTGDLHAYIYLKYTLGTTLASVLLVLVLGMPWGIMWGLL